MRRQRQSRHSDSESISVFTWHTTALCSL